jgi:hypothetical protein
VAKSLNAKKRQAIKEEGLILTLPEDNAAADTLNSLSSANKDTTTQSEEQVNYNNKATNQGDAAVGKPIMCLENHSRNEIKGIVKDHLSQVETETDR